MAPYFSIEHTEKAEQKFIFRIRLNAEHPVYKGHFPDVPVTPGVVLTDICRQLAQEITGKKLQLKESKSIKFLAMVNPLATPVLHVAIDLSQTDQHYSVQFTGSFDERVYFKIHGRFTAHA